MSYPRLPGNEPGTVRNKVRLIRWLGPRSAETRVELLCLQCNRRFTTTNWYNGAHRNSYTQGCRDCYTAWQGRRAKICDTCNTIDRSKFKPKGKVSRCMACDQAAYRNGQCHCGRAIRLTRPCQCGR